MNADARLLQLVDDFKQFRHLDIGQRGGRLIEDQQSHFGEEGFGNFNHLLVSARQVTHLERRIEMEAEFAHDFQRPAAHGAKIEKPAGANFAPEKEILFNGHLRH